MKVNDNLYVVFICRESDDACNDIDLQMILSL